MDVTDERIQPGVMGCIQDNAGHFHWGYWNQYRRWQIIESDGRQGGVLMPYLIKHFDWTYA